jgi:phage virion morphogenesis protein
MTIRVDVRGAQEVEAALSRLSTAIDPVFILDEASALILARMRKRFREEVRPDGIKWKPLKPSTILERIRLGFGPRPILYRTGHLFRSIQLHADGPKSRAISTDVEYASFLQNGSSNMPARPFLGIGKGDAQLVTALIVKRIRSVL